VYHICTSDM